MKAVREVGDRLATKLLEIYTHGQVLMQVLSI